MMAYWIVVSSGRALPVAIVTVLGQIALLIGIMVLFFAVIALQFVKVRELYGSGDSSAPDERTNCSSCGARVSVEADTCSYCGEPTDR